MQIFDCFPSPYIKAADLQGQEVSVVVDTIKMEEVGHPKESRPVCYFAGHTKGMVLNVTNSGTIVSMYGENTAEWNGRPITLFPTTTEFGGRTVPCIRVRPAPPQMPQSVAVQTPVQLPQPPAETAPQDPTPQATIGGPKF